MNSKRFPNNDSKCFPNKFQNSNFSKLWKRFGFVILSLENRFSTIVPNIFQMNPVFLQTLEGTYFFQCSTLAVRSLYSIIAWLKFLPGLLLIFMLILIVYRAHSFLVFARTKSFWSWTGITDNNNGPEKFFKIKYVITWDYVTDFRRLQL